MHLVEKRQSDDGRNLAHDAERVEPVPFLQFLGVLRPCPLNGDFLVFDNVGRNPPILSAVPEARQVQAQLRVAIKHFIFGAG